MKVWIAHVSASGLVRWRWTDDEGLDGAATTKGLRVPESIYQEGREAVAEAFAALIDLMNHELRHRGWRVRRQLIERVPFRDELLLQLLKFVVVFGKLQRQLPSRS